MPSTKNRTSLHGVLVDIYGVGVVLMGPSGIGKSECALDLVARGHRLVADDLVIVEIDRAGALIGMAPEISRHYIEVRGLGIINIKDIYGAASIRDRKKVDLILEIVPLAKGIDLDRTGIEMGEMDILKTKVPKVQVPSWPGRSLTTIIEVAARNQILRWGGQDSALEFERKHRENQCEPS